MDLPHGTLTFLMTDVEGSTPLWEQHEELMRTVLPRHDALVDAAIAAEGGRRVHERGEGDSIFVVFTRPRVAVAALAIAQALRVEPWPAQTPIRVRMGLHTGTAAVRDGDYYGPVVNRCARIRALGHGGQILLSSTLAAQVQDILPAEASLRSLGAHSLKGLQQPEEVFQLLHPDLPASFPPLLSPQAPKTNLPAVLSSFVGRAGEQAEVMALLATTRLVTLTGTGGAGKTRLALQVAGELVDAYREGVWLVELAALADPALVPAAVASVLGVREESGRSLLATLTDHLRARNLLLVLDNCEHLLDACADLATTLLRACPGVRLLATSRAGLAVAGEQRYRVPSLPVPASAPLPPLDGLVDYEAVALFVARAQERQTDFALSTQNARAVVEVCARLEGIPLAIELAAARVGSLSVEGIASRLDDRFRLLTGGPRSALPRQQTLQNALDWSHELLAPLEQVVLRRLSAFVAGCTLAAAEAVCVGDGLDAWALLDALDALVDKSLLQVRDAAGETRYGLLETVRQYARQKLVVAGEMEVIRDRHVAWSVTLAEDAEPQLRGPEQATWLDRLEREHDNLRAALQWSLRDGGTAAGGVHLAVALWRFWWMHGHLSEGRGWLDDALRHAAGVPALVGARALSAAGNLAMSQSDFTQARVLLEESLTLKRELGDTQGIAASLNSLGNIADEQGDSARAAALYEESLALFRELGDRWYIAALLDNLGLATNKLGDQERAVALHTEALQLFRDLGDKHDLTMALDNLAHVARYRRDYAQAKVLLDESLTLRRELDDKSGIAITLHNLAWVAEKEGDYAQTTALLEEGLRLAGDIGDRLLICKFLAGGARVSVAQALPQRAARLLGAAEALREAIGGLPEPRERGDHDAVVQAVAC